MTDDPHTGRAAQIAAPIDDPTLIAFMAIVDRLESIVDAETESLHRNRSDRVGETGQRKRQGMLELARVMRVLTRGGTPTPVRERLDRFATKLEHNRSILDVHLRAVRDVAETIARTLREAESDGTYCLLVDRL